MLQATANSALKLPPLQHAQDGRARRKGGGGGGGGTQRDSGRRCKDRTGMSRPGQQLYFANHCYLHSAIFTANEVPGHLHLLKEFGSKHGANAAAKI